MDGGAMTGRWTPAELAEASREVEGAKDAIRAAEAAAALSARASRYYTTAQRELASSYAAENAARLPVLRDGIALHTALVTERCSYCQALMLGADSCATCGGPSDMGPVHAKARALLLRAP
jgi:hypothetical protein